MSSFVLFFCKPGEASLGWARSGGLILLCAPGRQGEASLGWARAGVAKSTFRSYIRFSVECLLRCMYDCILKGGSARVRPISSIGRAHFVLESIRWLLGVVVRYL